MDGGTRPVVADVTDRLSRQLVEAGDLDALARTLLSGLAAPRPRPSVRGAALGLVEGAGRRLRFLSTDRDLGEEGQHPDWTHIDAYADTPLNRVVRTREPIIGPLESLEGTFPVFCRERRKEGALSIAVLPLEPVVAAREVAEVAGPPNRPLGALAVCYLDPQEFDAPQREELDGLARVVSHGLRGLASGGSPHPVVPGDPLGVGAAEVATLLPSDERAPFIARRFLRDQLGTWGVPEEAVATAELCLSELVTNAVIHARTASHLLVALIEGMLEVGVRDHGGPPQPRKVLAPVEAAQGSLRVYGRGLMLVDTLSSEWGAEATQDGMSVWFTLALGDTI